MNDHELHCHVRRLLLAVATDLDDARRTLLRDVGLDVDDWYAIACLTAQEAVRLLDAEYLAAMASRDIGEAVHDHADKDLPPEQQIRTLAAAGGFDALDDPGLFTRAREHTIRRIERMLAEVLDT